MRAVRNKKVPVNRYFFRTGTEEIKKSEKNGKLQLMGLMLSGSSGKATKIIRNARMQGSRWLTNELVSII